MDEHTTQEQQEQQEQRQQEQQRQQDQQQRQQDHQQQRQQQQERQQEQQRQQEQEKQEQQEQQQEKQEQKEKMQVQAQQQVVMVSVPEGIGPGEQMIVLLDNGVQLLVDVPAGCYTGATVQVPIPAVANVGVKRGSSDISDEPQEECSIRPFKRPRQTLVDQQEDDGSETTGIAHC